MGTRGEMRALIQDIIEAENEKKVNQQAIAEATMASEEGEYNKRMAIREQREKTKKAWSKFKPFVKNTLLEYAILEMMSDAIRFDILDPHEQRMAIRLIENFVKENGGATAILSRSGNSTYAMNYLSEVVDEVSKEIVDKADKDRPETLGMDKDDIDNFLKELRKEPSFDDIKQAITTKVVNAETEFIRTNAQDKADMEEIVNAAQEKIDAVQQDTSYTPEVKEEIAQEAEIAARRKINNLRDNKQRSVFDEMVHKFSKTIYTNDTLKNNYLTEEGNLKTANIVDTVRIMYSILETASTSRMMKIDEKYITDMLNNL